MGITYHPFLNLQKPLHRIYSPCPRPPLNPAAILPFLGTTIFDFGRVHTANEVDGDMGELAL